MLKYIVDHPGKTVTELSLEWDKTKAAISQMLKRMAAKGLIRWGDAPDSRKTVLLRHSKGEEPDRLHQDYKWEKN